MTKSEEAVADPCAPDAQTSQAEVELDVGLDIFGPWLADDAASSEGWRSVVPDRGFFRD